MCGPHHCLGLDGFASGPEILRRLLQLRQNASILEQGCAGFSPGSANRCDQFTRHPWRTSSPLRPSLSFRYTQVTESVVLPAFTSECITCPNPIVVPTHRCFPSSGRAALSVRVV